MKVFISSTYNDLIAERKAAIDIIDREDHAVAMEKFPAIEEIPKDLALSKLQDCDALILILGSKYGSLDPDENISITEIEYNTAKALKIPVFVFIKSGSEGKWGNEEEDETIKEQLDKFKSRLDSIEEKNHRKTFETPDQLAAEIIYALRNYEIENGMIGGILSIFTPYDEYSKPFMDRNKLFNHDYTLVGRDEDLKNLYDFICSDEKVALIYGRGGIGKSKILIEFGRKFDINHPDWKIRYLREGMELSKEDVNQLPARKCVIVADDVHRRSDIMILLNLMKKYPDRFKLILSFRSHGLNYINTVLSQASFDPSQIKNIPEIKDLKKSELKKLAIEILEESYNQFLDPLIDVAKDSTLVLVIGAQLINNELINPRLLERIPEFQRTVFDKFEEILTGEISTDIDPKLVKNLLSLISALSPISPQDQQFIKSASNFLLIEEHDLIRCIGVLEESGILLRRGNSLRVTPDVLSDHILNNTCISFSGQLTRYAERIFDAFWDLYPNNILFNLSELDWRNDNTTNLLNNIWNRIEKDFKEGSHSERAEILRNLDRVAYLQPAKVLEIVEYAINNPAENSSEEKSPYEYSYSHQSVLAMLPNLLKQIAIHSDYLPRCCDILWDLGKNETQSPPNFGPLINALRSILKYEINKPFWYNLKALNSTEEWFKDPKLSAYKSSPLDVIDVLFKKEDNTAIFERHMLNTQPFPVPYEETKEIRVKALSLVSEMSKSDSTKIRLRVLKSLTDGLRPVSGIYGREVSDYERNQWLPTQLKILEIVESMLKHDDPILNIQIIDDIDWYINYKYQEDIRAKSSSIIGLIKDSFDLRIHKAIWNNYPEYSMNKDQLNLIENDKKEAVNELLSEINDKKELFNFLNDILNNFGETKIIIHPENFFYLLSNEKPELSIQLCELIIADTKCALTKYIGSFLEGIKEKNKSKTLNLIKISLNTNDKTIYTSVAANYNYSKLGHPIDNDEIEFIKKLIAYDNQNVKKLAIESLRRFSDENEAIELAFSIEIDDNEELADSLCMVFDSRLGISPKKLSDDDLEIILFKFINVNELDDSLYSLDKFLGYCSTKIPDKIIDFFLKRLEMTEEKFEDNYKFKAIPYRFENGINVSSSPNYKDILRKVRDNTLNPHISKHSISDLFIEISDGFSEPSIEVLNEWIDSDDAKKIENVGLLIKNAPIDFLFSNYEFVSRLIEKSYVLSKDCYTNVIKFCEDINNPFDISRTPGEAPPAAVELRKNSNQISKKYNKGSPTEKFYSSLTKQAENTISKAAIEDEEDS
ncbi:MAG: hypothetical protein CVV28_05300 [Methanobacteriales archaeon HGW-Methanobacteriales-1]|jgi:hypothetical protein|nr:MAG: hypothetical protein CVV28_05300 [Methanobacteriales archaeon HGW-Methanobacteriales-1]